MSLQEYIDENGLSAKIISLDTPTSTVDESVVAPHIGLAAVGVHADDIAEQRTFVRHMLPFESHTGAHRAGGLNDDAFRGAKVILLPR